MAHGFKKITPVNGFDKHDQDNAKQNNYAWSMEEFGDYLYVGTGRNIVYSVLQSGLIPGFQVPETFVPKQLDMNAEIWRYKKDGSQTWQNVYKAPAELDIVGFRFMTTYTTPEGETALYAGCYTDGSNLIILKSLNGIDWIPLVTDINADSTRAMINHRGKLYMVALGEESTPIYVSSDPQREGWQLACAAGDPEKNPRGHIVTMISYNGRIYVATAPVGGFEVWRTNGPTPETDDWTLVVDKGAGDALNEIPLTMGVFRYHLYVGTAISFAISSIDPEKNFIPPKPFDLIRIHPDDRWDVIVGGNPVVPTVPTTGRRNKGLYPSGFGDISQGYCWQLKEYNNEFYLGTWNWSNLLLPLLSSLFETNRDFVKNLFNQVSDPRILKKLLNEYYLDPLLELLPSSLDSMVENFGFELWRSSTGKVWQPVTLDGMGNPCNYGLRNILPAGRRLYLGTANPFQGCEVWVKE
ncbi:MAG: hypothetical protein ACOYI2_04320 [Bacillota bacterium]|jgi:hypothetical protein|nr:hypothetical protein [Clostridia bacterium]